ncbi:hypothetical protein C4D60_Mb05t09800 [Musa balbisiana]|uniref:SUMO-activating enzyme subunit n=1 Tax=Musa balbisiana TaxID=52838 RepID=A0A4S8JV01_MUSBA|nr:hypothetical protein C4D60_Mb05t09800 [Musa balbisiana]
MDSDSKTEAIKRAKVLMVGAGGIGCELLKTLALSGFQDIHIIDMDTIEVSNLNRQFLFRQSHVGQSKAKVARDVVSRFMPQICITPYHANVKDPEFNVDFFKKFNVILNGLDNLDARRHVNRLCLAAEVPLVESGTTGFLGQVTVHIKGRTECYECQPKPTPKTYPVCTITSTPSKFVHCIVWAKDLLFAKLFGDRNQENDLFVHTGDGSDSAKPTDDIFERGLDEVPVHYGRKIYDHVFGYNIEVALANEETWKNRRRPRPIFLGDVLPEKLILQNGNHEKNCLTEDLSLSAMSSLGLNNPQEIWSLAENSRLFLEALRLFIERRGKVTIPFTFLMTYCLEHPCQKMLLMPVEPFEANKSCYVCSETPLLLEVNTQTSTLRDFVDKIVKNKLGMSFPLIMQGAILIFEGGDDLEEDVAANYALNLDKVLTALPAPVTSGSMLTVEDLQQELLCHINIKHREEFDEEKEPDRMVLLGWTTPEKESQGVSNGENTTAAIPAAPEAINKSEEVEVAAEISRTKRKLSEMSETTEVQEIFQILPDTDANNSMDPQEVEDNDYDNDLIVLDENPEASKKRRLQ